MNQTYLDVVRLLLEGAPVVFQEAPRFAMKGGTALNLFVQDLPRLSVDIDIAFTDHAAQRDEALKAISQDLAAARSVLERRGFGVTMAGETKGEEVKMFVQDDVAQVKVEVNAVFRGTLLSVEERNLVLSAQELFTADIKVPMLNIAELYGSKLVAVMDRQHPRDLFDVQRMLDGFGLKPEFVDCFVAYLAGHNRPVHEVLFPTAKDIEAVYRSDFVGMTREDISLDALLQAQSAIREKLPRALTAAHREFLLSLVRLEPAWELMSFARLRDLPALRWKLLNLAKLKRTHRARFEQQHDLLQQRLRGLHSTHRETNDEK